MNAALLAAIGAGLVTFGAAFGIGKLGASATESIARQPEAAENVQKALVLAAAMIEGVALFSVIVCLIAALKG